MQKKKRSLYHGHRFPAVVISQAVRWYFRFQLSLRDIEELLFERGVIVSYETIRRNRLAMLLGHVNTNEQIVQRPLLTPDECMRLPADDEIVFVSGHAPIRCQKIVYHADAALAERIKVGVASGTGRGT